MCLRRCSMYVRARLLRRIWGWALLMWGLGDLAYLICYLIAPMPLMNIGAEHITVYELLFGNTIVLVDTCECFTDIQWYNRKDASEPWQIIPGATGHY